MKKRLVCLLLLTLMVLEIFSGTAMAATQTGGVSSASNYLKNDDYIVISPAECWKDGKRIAVETTEWELTAQHSGSANGNDIQTWKYGVSDKFRVLDCKIIDARKGGTQIIGFRLQCKEFRESDGGRYWDIEHRSKNPGGNLHVWNWENSDSQFFYLEEDDDSDGETFYIKNHNSGLYLAPENYFKNPKNNCGQGRNSWSEEGCNVVQSNYAFRWRIQVLNRDAAIDAGGKDKYANWMSLLPDTRLLSAINIPGTHDSGTANVEGSWNSSSNVVACQKYFIEQQLYAGVRSLDIRTQWHSGTNAMVLTHNGYICHTPNHGSSKNKTFASVLDTLIAFLKTHPKEAIVLTLKIDSGDTDKGTTELQNVLNTFLNDTEKSKYFYNWVSDPDGKDYFGVQKAMSSPTLGAVRGKIVIMTRVDFSSKIDRRLWSVTGPNLTQWDKKYDDDKHYAQLITTSTVTDTQGVKVYIQDDYSSPDGNKKTQVFNTIYQLNGKLNQSGAETPRTKDFVFNYTSKTTSSTKGATPLGGAKYMNDILYNDDLFTVGTAEANENPRLGIVVMDYVNKQLCRRIIDRNQFPSGASMRIPTVSPSQLLKDQLGLLSASADEPAAFALDELQTALFVAQTESENEDADTATEIIWPESAEVTYGYVLGEAKLNFAVTAEQGKRGVFEFAEPEEIIAATETVDQTGTVTADAPVRRTLRFIPDTGAVEEKTIPVTVHRRPLPIKIADYEVEYGGEFKRSDLSVTAGGYLLEKDLISLPQIIETEDIHWVLKYKGDLNEIPRPDVPSTNVLASGTIELKAENVSADALIRFPNYDYTMEIGYWSIVPRTVTVEWHFGPDGWTATIGNVINNDDVAAELGPDGQLHLTGRNADLYQIAYEDLTPPENDVDYDALLPILAAAQAGAKTGALPFTDVSAAYYAADAIRWAWENGYFSGVSAVQFAPEQGLSRAMLVTVLWRMAGEPNAGVSTFADVLPGGWYEKAVAWANARGLVSGTGAGSFSPDAPITREQLIAILWRYAGSPQPAGGLSAFSDGAQTSAYAQTAMAWAVETGLIGGSNGRLLPASGATRAQTALILQRFAAWMGM